MSSSGNCRFLSRDETKEKKTETNASAALFVVSRESILFLLVVRHRFVGTVADSMVCSEQLPHTREQDDGRDWTNKTTTTTNPQRERRHTTEKRKTSEEASNKRKSDVQTGKPFPVSPLTPPFRNSSERTTIKSTISLSYPILSYLWML